MGRRHALAGFVLFAALLLAACGGGSPAAPSPTADGTGDDEPTPTPTATATPVPNCPVDQPACAFAVEVDAALAANDVAPLVRGSAWEEASRQEELRVTLSAFAVRRVAAIGCPFDATAPSCAERFALAVTSLPFGNHPDSETAMFVLAFERFITGGQRLVSVERMTDPFSLRQAVYGGIVQETRYWGGNGPGVRAWFYPFDAQGREVPDPFPSEVNGVPVRQLTLAPSQPIPSNGALYIETGCWGCDSGMGPLVRIMGSGAEIHRDEAFALWGSMYLFGRTPGAVFLAQGCSGIGLPPPDVRTAFFSSTDGGVTFTSRGDLPRCAHPVWVSGDLGEALIVWAEGDDPASWTYGLYRYPSLERLPLDGQIAADLMWRGAFATPGPILAASETLVQLDGSTWFDPHLDGLPNESGLRFAVEPTAKSILAMWTMEAGTTAGGTAYRHYLASYNGGQLVAVYDDPFQFYPSVWLSSSVVLGNAAYLPDELLGLPPADLPGAWRFVPVLVDLRAGTIAPIEAEYFAREYAFNRSRIHHYIEGPLYRVEGAGEGDCLNVRAQPSATSPVLGCYADGVILQDRGETTEADGVTWAAVRTPDGRPGHASAAFLAR
jgi:hypothetical protein